MPLKPLQKKLDRAEILKDVYFMQIRKLDRKKQTYPRTARRRGITGEVKASFTISPKGELLGIKIIKGRKIFHKAVKKAIIKSFPFSPPNGIHR